MSGTVSTSIDVAADPTTVWRMVADVTRMGEWSDETTACTWTKGATGPTLGATFTGRNRRGWHRWSTRCTVTAAAKGDVFAFLVSSVGLPVATWKYDMVASGTGCTVTETWTDHRPLVVKLAGRAMTGRPHMADDNLVSMRATLAALKVAAEQ